VRGQELREAAKRTLGTVAPSFAFRRRMWRNVDPWVIPRGLERLDPASDDVAWFGHEGIDLREPRQLELLARWERHADLFASLRADAAINTAAHGEDRIENGWYQTPDPEAYAAFIADERPSAILEIGGGYSTLVARHAIERTGVDTTLVVVDPEPRTDVRAAADELHLEAIEDVDPARLPLDRPLLLFVDSSHITRTGGDVPVIFNRLLPRLAPGSLVHAHDVYLPYDYPPRYQYRLYTEQYVLHALLADSPRYRVELAAFLMTERHPDAMRRTFGPAPGRDGRHRGASFWFRVRG
jgi:hypothetical protein